MHVYICLVHKTLDMTSKPDTWNNIFVNQKSGARYFHSARVSFMQNLVPYFIEFQHIGHGDFFGFTPPLLYTLCLPMISKMLQLLSWTYIYLQKSSDYERVLVKQMVVVGTANYILSVQGQYFANTKHNDAAITKHMVSLNVEEMNEWLQTSDVCVVDSGF